MKTITKLSVKLKKIANKVKETFTSIWSKFSSEDKANITWGASGLVFGIISIIPMIAIEAYKIYTGQSNNIAWSAVIRWALLIGIFSVFHWFWVENFTSWSWVWCL